MAALKPAYLIHGDDHGAVAERRAGLRALAEAGEGAGASVEVLEGDQATPLGVAEALSTMTLALGGPDLEGVGRVIIVEGIERWRQADVEKHLVPALESMPPATTVALFAREEARAKAPAALHEAVKRAGGQVVAQTTVKPWELAKWTREQADRLGLSLDAAAAKALVAQVGERQQRLLRELEKLALEGEGPREIDAGEIESRAAHSSEWRAYALADALVGGHTREATLAYVRLRQQGERVSGLTYLMAQRLRDALAIAIRLQAGVPAAEIKRGLRMPARAAERFVADAARSEPERLRRALAALADLELDSRGGAPLSSSRTPFAGLDEDTLALQAIQTITA
ncbi:MAG TPA: DNA polymerase III subunit delta [Solirubrobacteraceae bacterium]|nr:DNA polymerase III subunit delta [Solirubrobacteraceae bacterium]